MPFKLSMSISFMSGADCRRAKAKGKDKCAGKLGIMECWNSGRMESRGFAPGVYPIIPSFHLSIIPLFPTLRLTLPVYAHLTTCVGDLLSKTSMFLQIRSSPLQKRLTIARGLRVECQKTPMFSDRLTGLRPVHPKPHPLPSTPALRHSTTPFHPAVPRPSTLDLRLSTSFSLLFVISVAFC